MIVPSTHGWIKFGRAENVKTGGAGIVWYWPVTTELHVYPTARQTVSLPTQVITTEDDQTIAISGLLVYEIEDLEKILAHTYDPEDSVKDIATSALHDAVSHKSYTELKRLMGRRLATVLKAEAQRALRAYGVKVTRMTITTFAKARVLRLVQTTSAEGT